jgi:hypothetical protein
VLPGVVGARIIWNFLDCMIVSSSLFLSYEAVTSLTDHGLGING